MLAIVELIKEPSKERFKDRTFSRSKFIYMIFVVDVSYSVGYNPKFKFFSFEIVLDWIKFEGFDFWLSTFFVVGLF